MSTGIKIGFFHDYNIAFGSVLSESDPSAKYNIAVEAITTSSGNSAELSIVGVDDAKSLDTTNGMTIKSINTGPLVDKHGNYRHPVDVPDPSLGVARITIEDHEDTSDEKSRDEYWAQCRYGIIPAAAAGAELVQVGHSDGTVLMRATSRIYNTTYKRVYVSTRSESTQAWGAYVTVDTVSRIYSGSNYIEVYPAFVTIPNLGTLLFYFGLQEDASTSGYKNQYVYVSITKDHGTTWERYGQFIIEPFYGDVSQPLDETLPYAYETSAVLKATFYNNKLVVGMMLHGTEEAIHTQTIGTGTTSLDTFTDTLDIPTGKSIKPYSVVAKNGSTIKATDDGAGVISGSNVTGTVDYDSGDITVEETGATPGEWTTGEDCDVEFEDDGIHSYRILNLVISEDLGKSWTTVPQEFVSSSIEGQIPGEAYLFGDPVIASDTFSPNSAASNFGLGYDPQGDKFVLVLKSTGSYQELSSRRSQHYVNISKLYFYYNVKDDLLDWEASIVDTTSYKLIDQFTKSSLAEKYEIFDYAGATNPPSDWNVSGGVLEEPSNINGPGYFSGQAKGGTQIIWLQDDPTMNRTVGVRVELNTTDVDDFGIGFCRQDSDNFYAIDFDCTNNAQASGGTVDVSVKRVLAGVETLIGSTATVQFVKNTWGTCIVLFSGEDEIKVYFNEDLIITTNDNNLRLGKVFLFSNGQQTASFDNLGLMTGRNTVQLVGSTLPGYDPPRQIPYEDAVRIGSNIDLTVDQFNQAWISADVSALSLGNNFFSHGMVLQKYRFVRDIERVEGQFLAKEIRKVYLADYEEYQQDVGNELSLLEYGIFVTHYGVSDRFRTMLDSLVWHKDDPTFFVRRHNYEGELFGLIQRDKSIALVGSESNNYSNRTLFANFNACWHAFNFDARPQTSGFEVDGGFTYTIVSDYTLRVTEDNVGYFMQEYDFTAGTVNTNASRSIPVRFFDYKTRGMTAFLSTRSYLSNLAGTARTVFECTMPYIIAGGSVTSNEVRFRIRFVEETSIGANDAKIEVEYYVQGTGWLFADRISSINLQLWWEFAIFVYPVDLAPNLSNRPELSIFGRPEGTTDWYAISQSHNLQEYATPGNTLGQVKLGCFDGTGGTPSQQEFKMFAYGDSCLVDPYLHRVIGESLQNGEPVRTPKGVTYSFGNGISFKGNEWKLTDESTRSYPKENILESPSSLWKSVDDSADKSIVIDAGHDLEYDTVILYGANCKNIIFDANTSDSWPSSSPLTLDMTEHDHLEYEKLTASDKTHIIHFTGLVPDFVQDGLKGRAFISETNSVGSYRVVSNDRRYIVYERSADAVTIPQTSSDFIDVLSDRIAIRFSTKRRHRYFRLTFDKGSFTYPTPEGYFQLGSLGIGMFDEFQWNPEYPEEKERTRNSSIVRLDGGAIKTKKRGPTTLKRTLNFNAIDMNVAGFKDQIYNMWKHARGKTVYYVPNIEEFNGSGYTYTFDVVACREQPSIGVPKNGGYLTSISLTFEEDPT